MGRTIPAQAEVVQRPHQSVPEEKLPDVVHRDPRGERVFGRDEPAGQVEPVEVARVRGQRTEDRRDSRLDLLTGREKIAPVQHVGLPRQEGRSDGPDLHRAGAMFLQERRDFLPEGAGALVPDNFRNVVVQEPAPRLGHALLRIHLEAVGHVLGWNMEAPRVAGQSSQVEAAERAPFAELLVEHDAEPRGVVQPQRRAGAELNPVRLPELASDRPARPAAVFPRQDRFRFESALRVVGLRAVKLHRFVSRSLVDHVRTEARQHEAAVGPAPGPPRGKRLVRQHPELEARDLGRRSTRRQCVPIALRARPHAEIRAEPVRGPDTRRRRKLEHFEGLLGEGRARSGHDAAMLVGLPREEAGRELGIAGSEGPLQRRQPPVQLRRLGPRRDLR